MKRTKGNIAMTTLLATMMLLAAGFMFSACSSDEPAPTPDNTPDSEIRMDANVWQVMEGTRATTFDNTTLQSSGFKVYAFSAGTETAYIDDKTVSYSDPNWTIAAGPYYWPAYHLDFFAYAPLLIPTSYMTTPLYSYSAGQYVTFTCSDLPVTSDGQGSISEFIYALAADQNKEDHAASGVALNFIHPFTRVKLQLSAGHPAIQINTITFRSIKNNGDYSSPTWTPTGDDTDLVWTLNTSYPYSSDVRVIGEPYLVIPQTWSGEIEVEAVWDVWGESQTKTVTATVPTTWAAGRSYTYTFTITETDLVVNTTKFTEQW